MKKNRNILLRFIGFYFSILFSLGGIIILHRGVTVAGIVVTIIGAILLVGLAIYNDKHPLSAEEALTYRPFLSPSLFWIASISIMLFAVSAMSNGVRATVTTCWACLGFFSAFPSIVFLCLDNNIYDLNRDMIATLVLIKGKSNIFFPSPKTIPIWNGLKKITRAHPGKKLGVI